MNPFTEMNFVWFECGGIWQDIGRYQFYISSHMLLLLVFILLYYSNSRVHKYTWWCGTAVSVLCGFAILYYCFRLLNFFLVVLNIWYYIYGSWLKELCFFYMAPKRTRFFNQESYKIILFFSCGFVILCSRVHTFRYDYIYRNHK